MWWAETLSKPKAFNNEGAGPIFTKYWELLFRFTEWNSEKTAIHLNHNGWMEH